MVFEIDHREVVPRRLIWHMVRDEYRGLWITCVHMLHPIELALDPKAFGRRTKSF